MSDKLFQIKDLKHLKLIAKKGRFDIKILLGNGLYSRKTVFRSLNCLNHVDNTKTIIRSPKIKNAYWNRYFANYKIIFDGYANET